MTQTPSDWVSCFKTRDLCQTHTVFKVEVAGRLCRPQPHGVNNIVSVARYRCVVWQSQHNLRVHPFNAIGVMLGPAIEVNGSHVLRTGLLPGVAIAQPIISLLNLDNRMTRTLIMWEASKLSQTRKITTGSQLWRRKLILRVIKGEIRIAISWSLKLQVDLFFYLPAIDDFLIEDAELIANAITIGCQAQWGHGVQETSWGNDREQGRRRGWDKSVRSNKHLSVSSRSVAHQQGDPALRCLNQRLPRYPAAPPCPVPTEEHIDTIFWQNKCSGINNAGWALNITSPQ